jgi:tellurite resistance protein
MSLHKRIRHLPVSIFSIILGLSGLTIAYQKIEEMLDLPFRISNMLLFMAVVAFSLIALAYAYKLFFFWEQVRSEFHHPIKLAFFPTFSISLLLLAIAFLPIDTDTSRLFWLVGSILQLLLTIKIVAAWVRRSKFEIKHMNPAWFIPAVGNILVPIAGLHFFSAEFSWFFFAVGFAFWPILLTIFFNRIVFHEPLPEKLLPTFFILIAPPSVGFISWVKLTGGVNDLARVLYYIGLFFFLLLFSHLKMFGRKKFYLSWWAYSFPLAAFTIATVLMFHETGLVFFRYLAVGVFLVANLLVIFLLLRTVKALLQKEVCVEED